MLDIIGQRKTESLGLLGILTCVAVWDCRLSLPSEGRGHRFESCRVHHASAREVSRNELPLQHFDAGECGNREL